MIFPVQIDSIIRTLCKVFARTAQAFLSWTRRVPLVLVVSGTGMFLPRKFCGWLLLRTRGGTCTLYQEEVPKLNCVINKSSTILFDFVGWALTGLKHSVHLETKPSKAR